jgi:hypothetical protein
MSSALAFPNSNPATQLNGNGLVNPDSSGTGSFLFSNTRVPTGPHTLPPAGSNIQGAASQYLLRGGKVDRKKINKISRKYKMKGSKRTIRRRVRKIKSRVRSRYSKRYLSRHSRRYKMKGGSTAAMTVPNYPTGGSQHLNNAIYNNTYSLGGQLPPSLSPMATPPPYQLVANAANVDNLNHNTMNAFGYSGAGSGFVSRGSF